MPWEMEYVAGKETLVVAPFGRLSDNDVKQLTGEEIALLKQTQATRVLGDCRSIQSPPSLAAVYWLVQEYRQLRPPQGNQDRPGSLRQATRRGGRPILRDRLLQPALRRQSLRERRGRRDLARLRPDGVSGNPNPGCAPRARC